MPKLRALKAKEIVKALVRAGFYAHRHRGSHIQLRHRTKVHLRVTIPFHSHFDIPLSVAKSILKQAEISQDDFLKLL